MDLERERIEADLRGLLDCEVRCDDIFLQMYASDASIYEIKPLAVVRPRGLADVVACVQYAAEHEIPLHPRGTGAGLAGESLGPGLVLDFSRAMRRIERLDAERVRVQPGVVHGQLNRQLAPFGRQFGPDPATGPVSTLGGVLALNSSGSHWLRYGSPRQHVESLQIVLADGHVMEVGRHAYAPPDSPDPRCRQLVCQLAELLERNADIIRRHQPRSRVNRCGYHVEDVLRDGQLDLAGLLVGSEGTLALITEATLRLQRLPAHRGVALLFFDRLENAAHGAQIVARMGVSACDLMDRRLLTIARENEVPFELLVPREAEAMLLVEFESDDAREVRDRLREAVRKLTREDSIAFHAQTATEPDDVELFWRLARHVVPTLYRLKGHTRPLPFVEDLAIPPECLPSFVVRLQNVLKEHQVTASLFAHAGHGQLHVRPFLDLGNPADVRTMQRLAVALNEEVLSVGGTISGEHGDGLSRTWFVQRQYGPLFEVFREIKRIFDPQNILNPGKKVAEHPQTVTSNLRPVPSAMPWDEAQRESAEGDETAVGNPSGGDTVAAGSLAAGLAPDTRKAAVGEAGKRELIPLQLAWRDVDIGLMTRACNGCGSCRTQHPGERMCPMFRFAPREEASPRAKANLVRGVLAGQLDPSLLASDALKEVADLCFHCHQCRLECPAGVDIPQLVLECKAQYVGRNGLLMSDWFLTRLDLLAAWGSWSTPLTNWALANPQMRWLLEKVTGIAQGRKLPRLANRNFLRRAHRLRLTRPARHRGRNVLFFLDLYANWFDVQLAEALVAVLRHNGITVYVPPRQLPSGMPMVAMGALDDARRVAESNVRFLAEAVRQGYHVVTTEPAAALCLQHEYPRLLDDDDARLVAEHTSEACTYLWRMHQQGQLELDLKPVNATLGYHQPCHTRAMRVGAPGENLLRLVPGLTVQRVERGCSGMAGTFGLKRENYRTSLRAGWGLISALRNPSLQAGTTECSACKIQMEQGSTKPTIHPVKVLALAYGLMPQVGALLTARGEDRIVT